MTPRFQHLDGLRGLAALNVVISHAVVALDFALYTGNPAASHAPWDVAVSAWPFLFPMAGANFSVCIFFVLSGYVLMHVYLRTGANPAELILRRYLRLMPPILAVVLFAWALLSSGAILNQEAALITRSEWLAVAMRFPPNLGDALNEALLSCFVGPWEFTRSYDSSLWTMPIEFAGSVILVACGVVGRRLGWNRLWGAVLLLLASAAANRFYVSLLLAGAGIYLLDVRQCLAGRAPKVLVLAGLLLALALGTVPYSAARGPWWDMLVAEALVLLQPPSTHAAFNIFDPVSSWHAIGAILLLLLIEASPAVQRRLAARPLQWLGSISFPLYLVHIPILYSLGCFVVLKLDQAGTSYGRLAITTACSYIAASIAAAALLTWAVERPAIRLSGPLSRAISGKLAAAGRLIRLPGRA